MVTRYKNPETLGLTVWQSSIIEGIAEGLTPDKSLTVRARRDYALDHVRTVMTSIETTDEVAYDRHGGILPSMLR